MATATGSDTPYCDGEDLASFIDGTLLGQLVVDNGVADTDPYNNAKYLEMVKAACGELESAAMVGGKYTADMLANMSGNAKSFRNSIIAGIVIGYMRDRRVVVREDELKQYVRSSKLLKDLREGIKIFPFQEIQDARTMSSRDESPQAQARRNTVVSEASRFFGGDGGYCNW